LQLLRGLILILFGIFDTRYQDVSLLLAQGAHGLVVSRLAASEQQGKNEERDKNGSTQEDFPLLV
jgi:hypothetical protein